jgi:hypothetical protein
MGAYSRTGAVLLLAGAAWGTVLDRAAVIVGRDVITESEVLEEVRVTAFLNQEPVDMSAAARRAAAERLVDQTLIRQEMKISNFAGPRPEDAEQMLRELQQRYGGAAGLEHGLEKYGIPEAELKQHLLWQIAALRFTDLRFRAGIQEPAGADLQGRGMAERSEPESDRVTATVDQRMDEWLKRTRDNTRIEYKAEAFQ